MTESNENATTVEPTVRPRRAPRSTVPPVVSLTALASGDETAVEAVAGALRHLGYWDGLPGGDTLPEAYKRLQRHLGHGPTATGRPELSSLTWLGLRTKMFTATD